MMDDLATSRRSYAALSFCPRQLVTTPLGTSPGRFVLSLSQKIKDHQPSGFVEWQDDSLSSLKFADEKHHFPKFQWPRIEDNWGMVSVLLHVQPHSDPLRRCGFGLTRWPTWSWESPRRRKLRGLFPRGDPQSLWVFNIEMVMPWLGWFGGTPISMKPLDLTCLILV